MFNLLVVTSFVFMGTYADLPSCQSAIHDIYSVRMNPPGKQLPEIEASIRNLISTDKTFACIPVNKVDNKSPK